MSVCAVRAPSLVASACRSRRHPAGVGHSQRSLLMDFVVPDQHRSLPGLSEHELIRHLITERLVGETTTEPVHDHAVGGEVQRQPEEHLRRHRHRAGQGVTVEPGQMPAGCRAGRRAEPEAVTHRPRVAADRDVVGPASDEPLLQLGVALESAGGQHDGPPKRHLGLTLVPEADTRDTCLVTDELQVADVGQQVTRPCDLRRPAGEQVSDIDLAGPAPLQMVPPLRAHGHTGRTDVGDRLLVPFDDQPGQQRVPVRLYPSPDLDIRRGPQDAGRQGRRPAHLAPLLQQQNPAAKVDRPAGGRQASSPGPDNDQVERLRHLGCLGIHP